MYSKTYPQILWATWIKTACNPHQLVFQSVREESSKGEVD